MNKTDKNGIRFKYPGRTCKKCGWYPCFKGIETCRSNFAAYGCLDYKNK